MNGKQSAPRHSGPLLKNSDRRFKSAIRVKNMKKLNLKLKDFLKG